MKRSGIYCIENLKNEKKYIGQSADLKRREKEHFWMLEGNNHDNGHLQNSYNKYGEKAFKFRILLYCEPFELTRYEQFFVDYYTPKLLYNIRLECVNSNQGIIHSEETIRKMSEARCGENNPMYGKHHSEETIKKMSQNHADISGKNNPNYGKHFSKETKRKISEANGGENCYNSKLTENQVFEILDLYYNKGKSQIDIAKIFLVNNTTIFYIVRGKHWKSCYKKFMENNKK